LKYRGRAELGAILGELVAELVRPGAFDVVVPVPTPVERLVARGYNPAALLARPVAQRAGSPCSALALMRPSNAIAQATLPRAARLAIPRGTFVVARPGDVVQRRVLLVDDVVTTGATLRACAEALRRAGAIEVRAVTLTASTARPVEGGTAR
jgi:ComF family protein